MDIDSTKLTVFFEAPFWIGVFERIERRKLSVCKVVFGAEPKDYEVWEYLLKNYSRLRFSPSVETVVKKDSVNPKRLQRQIRKETAATGIFSVTTNSYKRLLEEFVRLYKRIVNPNYPIRQIGISFGNVVDEVYEQYDLFTDIEELEKEKRVQAALVEIRLKYGKNAVLKGMNLEEKATQRKRNTLVGGHNA